MTDKKEQLVRLIREREWRKQRDIQRWGVQPSRGIVSSFLDRELIDGAQPITKCWCWTGVPRETAGDLTSPSR